MHEKKNVETKINCRKKNEGEMDGDGDLGRLSRPSRKIHENESLSSPPHFQRRRAHSSKASLGCSHGAATLSVGPK